MKNKNKQLIKMCYSMYDEANIDIEEYLSSEESSQDNNVEEIDEEYIPKIIDYTTLIDELGIKIESDRTVFEFRYNGKNYRGRVIGKMNNEKFIFSVEDTDNPGVKMSKMFNINNIDQDYEAKETFS